MPVATLKCASILPLALSLLAACQVLQTMVPQSEDAALQAQRITQAQTELSELGEIEALIRLDNRWLEQHIERDITARVTSAPAYTLRWFDIDFGRQAALLDLLLDIGDGQGNVISASLKAEIVLDFNGEELEWFPLLHRFEITSRDFVYAGEVFEEPVPDLTQRLTREFEMHVLQALVDDGVNAIALDAVPLATVSVGASLPGFSTSPATASAALRGVFMVAGSAQLVESQVTTIALDMAFIPDLSSCPADVTVSRAGFVREVRDREPVGMARKMDDNTDISYFYSEIAGARQPLAIVHYWFADGLPMAAEELPVGPSYRWRTWSGRGTAGADAERWEVMVVEKESGCILHSQTLRTPEPRMEPGAVDPAEVRRMFTALTAAFADRLSGFTITADKPGIAQAEVSRAFYGGILEAAMADLSIEARFDASAIAPLQFEGGLQPLDIADVACERRDCPTPPLCKANLAQCKRLRDTRECSYCQFRNPLNNRCVSEVIDPLCEASRKRLNDKYEADRAACIANAEAQKNECDEQAAQALRSCELEAGRQDSACEAVKADMSALGPGDSLARVRTRAVAKGSLVANFSHFRPGEDLDELRLDMNLVPRLRLEGDMAFEPSGGAGLLAECINAWSRPYQARVDTAPDTSHLLTGFTASQDRLTAQWSGFGLNLTIRPSPIRAVFAGNPRLLADCGIGLTPSRVEQAVAGQDTGLFIGELDLLVQPLPTSILLAPATLRAGQSTHSAMPRLGGQTLRYDFED